MTEKTQLSNFHRLITDNEFWNKYRLSTTGPYRLKRLREYRTKFDKFPKKAMLENFIDEDYRFITGDNRDTREIIIWMCEKS